MLKFKNFLESSNLESKKHQFEAVKWCLIREKYGILCNKKKIKGGLIADEMGLGKTIQMLGTMISNYKKPNLLVLPRSLLEQWNNAILNTTPFKTHIFHGNNRNISIYDIKQFDIIITTYNQIQYNSNNKFKILQQIYWQRIIFDEAHHLRNSNTQIFKGALSLKSNIRWLLSGTPIQNSIKDLFNLFKQIKIPKKYYSNSDILNITIKNFILKRTKIQTNINIPTLNIINIEVNWNSNEEKYLSKEIHRQLKFSNLDENNLKIGQEFGKQTLPLLIRAKQSCISTNLLKSKIKNIQNNEKLMKEFPNEKTILSKAENCSSKINKVLEIILERKDNKNKKIIFSSFKKEIDYLEEKLQNLNFKTATFDGRIATNERSIILNDKNIDILIIQIQTGCEGLNLQHFNEIYFISPHWNPGIEDQAIARAHRLGQEKEVFIFKFTMKNFDEENSNICIENYTKNIQKIKRECMNIIDQ